MSLTTQSVNGVDIVHMMLILDQVHGNITLRMFEKVVRTNFLIFQASIQDLRVTFFLLFTWIIRKTSLSSYRYAIPSYYL